MRDAHELFFGDHKDTGVGFEIDSFCLLDNFKSFDGDVFLIAETETYEIQHLFAEINVPSSRLDRRRRKIEQRLL